jgi:hypothetical protein
MGAMRSLTLYFAYWPIQYYLHMPTNLKTGLQMQLLGSITQSTMRTFLAPAFCAANAATAALLWRQKPIAWFTPAWCPGGLTCQWVDTINIIHNKKGQPGEHSSHLRMVRRRVRPFGSYVHSLSYQCRIDEKIKIQIISTVPMQSHCEHA